MKNNNEIPTIGIDASRAFGNARTGTENYSYQLLQAIARYNCQYNFCLFLRPGQTVPTEFAPPKFETRLVDWPRLWTQGGLAWETWRRPVDLLFIPAHVIPFLKNPRVPVVVTVHDLRTEFLPQSSSLIQKIYLNRYTEQLRSRLAAHIIAVSEATKKDLVERLGVDPDKIMVVYEGVDDSRFAPKIQNSKFKIRKVKEKYRIGERYILFVGTVQPRKNLVRLVEAFSILNSQLSTLNLRLVIAGKKGWATEEIYAAPQKYGVEERVKFIDYVDDADLPYLYAGAEVFAFPSLYEGFGLPILESLASGTPVVTSNVSSMPEVGGDAVIYVDPHNAQSIADGLTESLTTPFDHEKAQHQVNKFSWDKAAKETIRVFDRILGGKRGLFQ